jgi:fatty acid desaturase
MLQLLLGIYAIRIYLGRRRTAQSVSATYDGSQKKNDLMPLAAGATVHLAILFSLITIGAPYAAISWVIGMGMFFPFFAAIRQLLEHRPADNVPDGSATTRLFSDGLLAHFFGGAGFNRHLLHHLEPQISYTRLAEFEQFLSGTELKAWLDARRTTYSVAFCLLRKHLRHA